MLCRRRSLPNEPEKRPGAKENYGRQPVRTGVAEYEKTLGFFRQMENADRGTDAKPSGAAAAGDVPRDADQFGITATSKFERGAVGTGRERFAVNYTGFGTAALPQERNEGHSSPQTQRH